MTYDPRPALLQEAIYHLHPRYSWLTTPSRLQNYRALVAEAETSGEVEPCAACDGTGAVEVDHLDTYQGKIKVPVDCKHCHGLGRHVTTFHEPTPRSKKRTA